MKESQKLLSWAKETVETIVIAFFLAFVIITFVAQSFWIPTGSMKPNLEIKDRIIAYKLFFELENVDRGDIIVFKFPLNPKENFVKRAIGLPDDEVAIRDKKVYINGERLSEPYVVHADSAKGVPVRDEYGPITVPADSLFMLGDNRDFSDDSRFWGFVPAENIIGQAFLLYWPPWRIRILKGVSY